MSDEKEVLDDNDTGKEETLSKEKSGDDTFVMPTVDPDSGEAEKAADKADDGVAWEKRYKDLQSQKDKEVAAAQKEADRYKKLVAPFEKNIVDKDGELDFNFSEAEETGKETAVPQPPTDDEWATNPTAAAEKLYEYKEYKRQQKEAVQQEQEQIKQAEVEYKEGRTKSWNEAQDMFPDAKNPESALYKRADEILRADPRLSSSPNCDLIAIKLAALDLGIRPVKGASQNKKDSSYIISGKTGKGGKDSSSGKLSPDEFAQLSDSQQTDYMEKEVLGKGE